MLQIYVFFSRVSLLEPVFCQRMAVWLVADFVALSYQVSTTFDTRRAT